MQDRLVALRKERGVTVQELADLLGVSKRTYRGRETDKTELKLHEIALIADFFNVKISAIFTRKRLATIKN